MITVSCTEALLRVHLTKWLPSVNAYPQLELGKWEEVNELCYANCFYWGHFCLECHLEPFFYLSSRWVIAFKVIQDYLGKLMWVQKNVASSTVRLKTKIFMRTRSWSQGNAVGGSGEVSDWANGNGAQEEDWSIISCLLTTFIAMWSAAAGQQVTVLSF